jgi:restriction endonuclease S subunit
MLVFNPPQLTGLHADPAEAEPAQLEVTGKQLLKTDDILITIRNKPLKASVMVPDSFHVNSVAGQNIAVFRPDTTRINPIFLAGLLRSKHGQQLLEPYFSQSSTVPLISLTSLRNFEFLVPMLEVQNTLAKFMLEAERAERADLERIQQRRELVEATLAHTLGGR